MNRITMPHQGVLSKPLAHLQMNALCPAHSNNALKGKANNALKWKQRMCSS
jgi:hypothetical protein